MTWAGERIRKYGHINIEMIHLEETHTSLTLGYLRTVNYTVIFHSPQFTFCFMLLLVSRREGGKTWESIPESLTTQLYREVVVEDAKPHDLNEAF